MILHIFFTFWVAALSIGFSDAAAATPTLSILPPGGTYDQDQEVTLKCTAGQGGDTTTGFEYILDSTTYTPTPALGSFKIKMPIAMNGKKIKCRAKPGRTNSSEHVLKVRGLTTAYLSHESWPVMCGHLERFKCYNGNWPRQPANQWKFFKDGTEITRGVSGDTLNIILLQADEGKKLTCQHYNSDNAKALSRPYPIYFRIHTHEITSNRPNAIQLCGHNLTFTCEKNYYARYLTYMPTQFRFFDNVTQLYFTEGVSGPTLTMQVTADDDGRMLKCSYYNPACKYYEESRNELQLHILGKCSAGGTCYIIVTTTVMMVLLVGLVIRE